MIVETGTRKESATETAVLRLIKNAADLQVENDRLRTRIDTLAVTQHIVDNYIRETDWLQAVAEYEAEQER